MNLPLIVTAAMLSCLLCGCNGSSADVGHVIDVLAGKSDAEPLAFLAIEPSSAEVAAVAVEPVTPPCVPNVSASDNRFFLYDDCDGHLWGPDPKYW